MKVWTILLVLGLIPTALAAGTIVEATASSFRDDHGRACDSAPLRPFGELRSAIGGGSAIARVANGGDAITARFCLYDAWGIKRADLTTRFSAGERRDVEIPAPSGIYTIRVETDGLTASASMHTRWCASGVADTDISLQVNGSSGGGIRGGSCVGNTLALGGLGILGSGLALVLGKAPHLGAFLLYSRLAKPRLLDSALRGRLHELIAREPGIHTRELVRALDAADGQIAHHLGVLAREKLLASAGVPGFRHWFVAGRYAPEQMRGIAALRDPTRRRIYDAVVSQPDSSLGDVARLAGISAAQGSRAARALEKAGLIERRASGRALLLRPRRAPREVFGAAELARA